MVSNRVDEQDNFKNNAIRSDYIEPKHYFKLKDFLCFICREQFK